MGLLDLVKKNNKPSPMLATTLKKGKSADQCKCIDFFLSAEVAEKKKKGCLIL